MEEMNGYELCSKIKGNESTREIPVILITALSDAEDIINSMQAGGDCFLTKPYNEALIVSSINNLTAEENKLLPGDYEKMTLCPSRFPEPSTKLKPHLGKPLASSSPPTRTPLTRAKSLRKP